MDSETNGREFTLVEKLEQERHVLACSRKRIKEFADQRDPKAGPELTLAFRACEDARMRLGVAVTLLKGEDPFPTKLN